MRKTHKPAPSGELGTCLHRGITFDEKAPAREQWLVTEEYVSGYVVIGRHPNRDAARQQIRKMGRSP